MRALEEYFKSITQTLLGYDEQLYNHVTARIKDFTMIMKEKHTGDALADMFIMLRKVHAVEAVHADIFAPITNEKLLAQMRLITTPTKVDLLTKLATTMGDTYALIMRLFQEAQHGIYAAVASQDIDKVRALAEKYGQLDLLVAALRQDPAAGHKVIVDETTRQLKALGIATEYGENVAAKLPGSNIIFDINPLLNQKYIVEKGLNAVTTESGIDRLAVDATRTIYEGKATASTHGAPIEPITKAVAGALSSLILANNRSPLTLDALMALDTENSRAQRQGQQAYRGLQRAQLEQGVHVLDTVRVDTLYDMWRYKEVKNAFMSFSKSRSRREAIFATIKSRQYGANDTPMSVIYEREVAGKHFE